MYRPQFATDAAARMGMAAPVRMNAAGLATHVHAICVQQTVEAALTRPGITTPA